MSRLHWTRLHSGSANCQRLIRICYTPYRFRNRENCHRCIRTPDYYHERLIFIRLMAESFERKDLEFLVAATGAEAEKIYRLGQVETVLTTARSNPRNLRVIIDIELDVATD